MAKTKVTLTVDDNFGFFEGSEKVEFNTKPDKNPKLIGKLNKTFKPFKIYNDEPKLKIINLEKKKEYDKEFIIDFRKIDENNYSLKTGNYIGYIYDEKFNIQIESRFGESFLRHIINYASNIFIDTNQSGENVLDKDKNPFRLILALLFVNKLEKASISGLPKEYKRVYNNDLKFRGNIDINKYIKKDIPFKGSYSTSHREQLYIPEIINVIGKALKIINKDFGQSLISQRLNHLQNEILTSRTKTTVQKSDILKAKGHKVFSNSIYKPYQEVLKYAESIILNYDQTPSDEDTRNGAIGYLINIAELFEIYIRKILQNNFTDWSISSPAIKMYENTPLERKIIPDIVMRKDSKTIVLDVKYKRFNSSNDFTIKKPIDRGDFFQIHTYMYYYKEKELIAGGLVYPFDENTDKKNANTEITFLQTNAENGIKFCVFDLGIDDKKENFKDFEGKFIEKIGELSKRL